MGKQMKIRFGEFPEHHHFIVIARPFIEWTFKLVGWTIVVATISYAQEKTGSKILFWLWLVLDGLLLIFFYTFFQWIFSFQRDRTIISGKKLIRAAEQSTEEDASSGQPSRLAKIFERGRKGAIIILSFLALLSCQFAAQIVVEQIVKSIVEFQKSAGK